MDDTRKCTKCGKELPLSQFYKRKAKSGCIKYLAECKYCTKSRAVQWGRGHKEKRRLSRARWNSNHPEEVKAAKIRWRNNNPEYNAEWRRINIDKARENASMWRKNNYEKKRRLNAEWRKHNLDKARESSNKWRSNNRKHSAEYKKRRRATDPEFKMISNIRASVSRILKNNTKRGHTIELLGCSAEYLRHYLENQFTGDMNWDNYGPYGWHIDHIIPLSYFDMSDPEQQRRAWHYTNLQPLWAADNIRKSNKIGERQLVLL